MPPATLNLSGYFSPISETLPQNLTGSLPRTDDAKILLLGCGDISKVLFTIYSDKSAPVGKEKGATVRNIDFTCSSDDVAVIGKISAQAFDLSISLEGFVNLGNLAPGRNILILFAILQDKPNRQDFLIWEIQYHVFLTSDALCLLRTTAKTLLDLTENLEDWHDSPIGSRLKFASEYTLEQVREFWGRYINAPLPSKEQIMLCDMWNTYEQSKQLVSDQLPIQPSSEYGSYVSLRSRSNFIFYTTYWMSGVVFGSGDSAIHCNPTMVFSDVRGSKFALHYATNPVLAFNIAPAFEQLNPSNPFYIPGFTHSEDWKTVEARIALTMRKQFNLWSMSFRDEFEKVKVRFMVGDALAFCANLGYENDGVPFTYTRQWSSTPMKLDGETYQDDKKLVPRFFNVIDTSNLTESLGLLNVLVAILPLLLQDKSSTIFTEKLYIQHNEVGILDSLKADLCGDLTTMFRLLSIAPIPYIYNQPLSRPKTVDGVWQTVKIRGDGAHWHRTSWKVPPVREHDKRWFTIEANGHIKFTAFLCSVYFAMFAGESSDPNPDFVIRYTRADFVKFIFFLQHRVEADWLGILKDVSDRAKSDQFPEGVLKFGPLGDMELDIQLHLHGLWTHQIFRGPFFSPNQVPIMSQYPGALGQQDTGELVCINMVVPRSRMQGLEDSQVYLHKTQSPYVGTQTLRTSVHARNEDGPSTYLKFHSTIQLCFGTVMTASADSLQVEADPMGWEGNGDLVVWFLESTTALRENDPKKIRVSLYCHRSPGPSYYFGTEALKMDQIVYASQLAGQASSVYVTANPPELSIMDIRESYVRDDILPGA